MYQQMIRGILASQGLIGRYKPAEVEAWMRLEHPTLDGLSRRQFTAEVKVAVECIDAAGPGESAALCESMGVVS